LGVHELVLGKEKMSLPLLILLLRQLVVAVCVIQAKRSYGPGAERDEHGTEASDDDTVGGLKVPSTEVVTVKPPRPAPQEQGVPNDHKCEDCTERSPLHLPFHGQQHGIEPRLKP
jgi:hypothetical protein